MSAGDWCSPPAATPDEAQPGVPGQVPALAVPKERDAPVGCEICGNTRMGCWGAFGSCLPKKVAGSNGGDSCALQKLLKLLDRDKRRSARAYRRARNSLSLYARDEHFAEGTGGQPVKFRRDRVQILPKPRMAHSHAAVAVLAQAAFEVPVCVIVVLSFVTGGKIRLNLLPF